EVYARIGRTARTYALEEIPDRERIRSLWDRAHERWEKSRQTVRDGDMRSRATGGSAVPIDRRQSASAGTRRGVHPGTPPSTSYDRSADTGVRRRAASTARTPVEGSVYGSRSDSDMSKPKSNGTPAELRAASAMPQQPGQSRDGARGSAS